MLIDNISMEVKVTIGAGIGVCAFFGSIDSRDVTNIISIIGYSKAKLFSQHQFLMHDLILYYYSS